MDLNCWDYKNINLVKISKLIIVTIIYYKPKVNICINSEITVIYIN